MSATFKSRLPQIAADLAGHVDLAVKEATQLVAHAARDRAPVDEGDLRDAIHVDREGVAEYEVVAGDKKAFYGHMVEHGTTRQPPRPFLVPALEDSRTEIVQIVGAALRNL